MSHRIDRLLLLNSQRYTSFLLCSILKIGHRAIARLLYSEAHSLSTEVVTNYCTLVRWPRYSRSRYCALHYSDEDKVGYVDVVVALLCSLVLVSACVCAPQTVSFACCSKGKSDFMNRSCKRVQEEVVVVVVDFGLFALCGQCCWWRRWAMEVTLLLQLIFSIDTTSLALALLWALCKLTSKCCPLFHGSIALCSAAAENTMATHFNPNDMHSRSAA